MNLFELLSWLVVLAPLTMAIATVAASHLTNIYLKAGIYFAAVTIWIDLVLLTVIGIHSIFHYFDRRYAGRAPRLGLVSSLTLFLAAYGVLATVWTLLIRQIMMALIRSVGG